MLADIDLDLNNRWVSGPGTKDEARLVEFKRDTSGEIRVRFWSGGIQTELAEDAEGTFGIKTKGEYDAAPLVFADFWTKTGAGATTVYTFYPEFTGAALAALLGSGDADIGNDEDSHLGMCEIKWIADGKKHRTPTIDALIANDVNKDEDGTPSSVPTPDAEWVAHGHVQTLTAPQKLQARENIGSEHLTSDQIGSNPNIPQNITITGITSPAASDPLDLVRIADDGDFPAWEGDDFLCYNNDTDWVVEIAAGGSYIANIESLARTPVGLTGWTLDMGAGQPVIIGDAPIATHIGQFIRIATADPEIFDWWQHNGDLWVFVRTDGASTADADSILTALAALDAGQIVALRAILADASVNLNPLP